VKPPSRRRMQVEAALLPQHLPFHSRRNDHRGKRTILNNEW